MKLVLHLSLHEHHLAPLMTKKFETFLKCQPSDSNDQEGDRKRDKSECVGHMLHIVLYCNIC